MAQEDLGTTTESHLKPSFVKLLRQSLADRYQKLLDGAAPFVTSRWIFLLAVIAMYCIRVYILQGFYIVTYGLGIFMLNLFIGFLTPIDDADGDGPILPMGDKDEFKPFIRRLPEFKFWYASLKAMLIGFILTFISAFNVPVFWPILLIYFIVLFVLTMRKQINHMLKHKYIPFSVGKRRYNQSRKPAEDIRVK